jgi:hypothetical protein
VDVYFAIGNRSDFDRLRALARAVPADTWQKAAVGGAIDDLFLLPERPRKRAG